jgi:hypothetical protein
VISPNWRQTRIERFEADRTVAPIEDGLRAHDPAAVHAALAYLEADPRGFRTGYAKQRLLDKLRGQELDAAARARVATLALGAVDNGFCGTRRQYGRVVRKYATNELRRELRRRLRDTNDDVAWRATWLLMHVRKPGCSPDEIAIVRDGIRERAAHFDFLEHSTRLFARRLWTPAWEAELQDLARTERDLGARRLLEDRRQHREVQEWRASKRRNSATPSEEARSEGEG